MLLFFQMIEYRSMTDLEDASHCPIAQSLTIRVIKGGNRFRCHRRLGVQDSGNAAVFTFIALFALCAMSIQDDIDALATMAVAYFGYHRFVASISGRKTLSSHLRQSTYF
jgi:hypothetical protein